MNAISKLPGLQIDSVLVSTGSPNFVPPHWPPPNDFPVIYNAKGIVVSRFGDTNWDTSPWSGRASNINFGDGKTRGKRVSRPNADVFRMVAGWWLWGPNAVRSPRTLESRHCLLKPLFVTCTNAGIVASELYRFPKVIEQVATAIGTSRANEAISHLNNLWLARDDLGFVILDDAGLKLLSSLVPERNSTQTAYIPPRMWSYQVLRLKEFIDDYLGHQDKIEACYRFCLGAYAKNAAGSLAHSNDIKILNHRAPFASSNGARVHRNLEFHGPFRLTARRFGIEELLDRWVNASDASGIRAMSNYLSLTLKVGLAYVLSFSLMRVDEGISLRANCYEVERDPLGEDIHLVGGVTTKTIDDDDARWIVSPSVESAVNVMKSVASLRIEAAHLDPSIELSVEDLRNPLLQTWAYEPWGPFARNDKSKAGRRTYAEVLKAWPKLFDQEQMRITKEDLEIARRITFGLDPKVFAVGKLWPLTWHQLRRTGAVNMLASGLVSDASLQYQLKHASRAMSRYYGQNYYHLKAHLDHDTQGLYLREMYQTVVREFQELQSERYVSPYGEKRKSQIIAAISEKDHQGLLNDGMAGRISYRENIFGGCAKLGEPCKLGGISNVSGCMGSGSQKPCEELLANRDRRPAVVSLRDILLVKKAASPPDSALRESLEAQIESTERALNVIDTL